MSFGRCFLELLSEDLMLKHQKMHTSTDLLADTNGMVCWPVWLVFIEAGWRETILSRGRGGG